MILNAVNKNVYTRAACSAFVRVCYLGYLYLFSHRRGLTTTSQIAFKKHTKTAQHYYMYTLIEKNHHL